VKGAYLSLVAVYRTTSVCVNDMYYLVAPEGDAKKCECDMAPCQNVCRDQKSSAPEGIGSLTDDDFGKLTRDDIIKGALAMYGYNGRGNKIINITEMADEKNVREKLLGVEEWPHPANKLAQVENISSQVFSVEREIATLCNFTTSENYQVARQIRNSAHSHL
jgi:hypothetical protein